MFYGHGAPTRREKNPWPAVVVAVAIFLGLAAWVFKLSWDTAREPGQAAPAEPSTVPNESNPQGSGPRQSDSSAAIQAEDPAPSVEQAVTNQAASSPESGSAFMERIKSLAERSKRDGEACRQDWSAFRQTHDPDSPRLASLSLQDFQSSMNKLGAIPLSPPSSIEGWELVGNGVPADINANEFLEHFGNLLICNPADQYHFLKKLLERSEKESWEPAKKSALLKAIGAFLKKDADQVFPLIVPLLRLALIDLLASAGHLDEATAAPFRELRKVATAARNDMQDELSAHADPAQHLKNAISETEKARLLRDRYRKLVGSIPF